MKKMLKIMAMLLVIATVIFAAGCAEKTETGTEEGAPAEVTEATEVADESVNESEVVADVAAEENVTVSSCSRRRC